MKRKLTLLFTLLGLMMSEAALAQTTKSESGSGLMAVRSLIMSASSVGGAGAYAASERLACDFAKASTVPRCVNSIFGLLQLELSLQGLENSKNTAIEFLGEANPSLQIDLKSEGFCISPLTDACTQDEVDKAVVGLYSPLKTGVQADYTAALTNLRSQIDGKISEFEANGYIIDKVARKVTPPLGVPQSFSGGTAVAAVLFKKSEDKFSKIVVKSEDVIVQQNLFDVDSLIRVAQMLLEQEEAEAKTVSLSSINSKTSSSFLAGLTDSQKSVAAVAPQGEEVFSSVSERYEKMKKSGDFIQP